MQEIIIDLHFRANDFREVYFTKEKSSVFTWQYTQKEMLYAGSFAMVAILFYLIADKSGSVTSIMFLLIAITVMIIYIVRLVININRFTTWKRSIEKWLKDYSKYQKSQLVLHPAFLEFIQDNDRYLENWETIKAVQLKNHLITITGQGDSYIFPAKSMRPDEFELLKNFIRNKLKNTILKDPGLPEK